MAQALNDAPFRGYTREARIDVSERELAPKGWTPHVSMAGEQPGIKPFCFLEVLKRNPDFIGDHGPDRIALLFLGADGFAAFDALFCQDRSEIACPFAVVLQNHGPMPNFGREGSLERLARMASLKPELLLVAQNTSEWAGYGAVAGVEWAFGARHERQLCAQIGAGE